METKQEKKSGYSLWQVMFFAFVMLMMQRFYENFRGWFKAAKAPAQAVAQPSSTAPMPIRQTNPKSATSPAADRFNDTHVPSANLKFSGLLPGAPPNNRAQPSERVQYPPEFEAICGKNSDSEFAKVYELNFKKEIGVELNDQQRQYVTDVITKAYKQRLFEIFQSMGNAIPAEKLDAVFDQGFTEVTNESGPVFQAELLGMMDGAQVAKLNSFLSGINVASGGTTDDGFTPAFKYLWSGGQGDEYVVAFSQRTLGTMFGVSLNEDQVAYIRNTIVPNWKAHAAAGFEKLDLSSGNVTGREIVAVLSEYLANSSAEHMNQLGSMMDANQQRLMQLQSDGDNQPK